MGIRNPAISVLMSAYNSASYITEAIESVLNQTHTDFEFIIYEDCSTDDTLSILKRYAAQDKRIKLIVNSENKGLTANLIHGVNSAKGKYLARMDADDVCMPDRLQKQYEYLERNLEISVLGSAVIFFDDEIEILGTQPINHDEINIQLLLGFTMLHPSVMFRLADFHLYQLNYNKDFRYSQDFDLWTRAIRVLKFANLPEPLLKMREHGLKISKLLRTDQTELSNKIRLSQYNRLKVRLSELEIGALNNNATGIMANNFDEIKALEAALFKIIQHNNIHEIYNKKLLLKKIKENLYTNYYKLLSQKDLLGLNIWKSKFRILKEQSIKSNLKTVFRSLMTILMYKKPK